MEHDSATAKAGLRTEYKLRRDGLTVDERARFSTNICEQLLALPELAAASRIFVYISCKSEVDTHALIDELLRRKKTLAVPKITSGKEMIAVRFQSWDDCRPAELGILTPLGHESYPGPFDIAITPGIAFTRAGVRLGFGAGYYDRWFSKNQVAHKIAVAFACQLAPDLPEDPYDVPVDLILTEREAIDARRPRRAT